MKKIIIFSSFSFPSAQPEGVIKEVFERYKPNEWNQWPEIGKVVIVITPNLSGLIVDNFQTSDTNRKYQWVVSEASDNWIESNKA